jgi:hypothetical protein
MRIGNWLLPAICGEKAMVSSSWNMLLFHDLPMTGGSHPIVYAAKKGAGRFLSPKTFTIFRVYIS